MADDKIADVTIRLHPEFDDSSIGRLQSAVSKSIASPLISSTIEIGRSFSSMLANVRTLLGQFFAGSARETKEGMPDTSGRIGRDLLGVGMGILGFVAGLFEIASGLAPVRTMMSAITSMFQMVFLPIGMILMAFLIPVLQGLAMVLQSKTFQHLLDETSEFVSFVTKLDIPRLVWEALVRLYDQLTKWFGSVINTTRASIVFALELLAMLGRDIVGWARDFGRAILVLVGLVRSSLLLIYSFGVMAWAGIRVFYSLALSTLRTFWGDSVAFFRAMSAGVAVLVRMIIFVGDLMAGVFRSFIAWLWDRLSGAFSFIHGIIERVFGFLTGVFHPILADIRNILHFIYSLVRHITSLVNPEHIVGAIESLPQSLGNSLGTFFSNIAKLDTGGYISSSGLAVVHKGEHVVPAGHTLEGRENNVYNINLNMHLYGVTNVKELADKIQKEIEHRTGRMLRWSS